MKLSNYHTHTSLCDGKDSAEEMILQAIEQGCAEIGFSGHSNTPFDPDYCMSENVIEEYKRVIRGLSKKYSDKIKIFMGIEEDYYSNTDTSDFDYVIGSVHYVFKDGEYIPIDLSREQQLAAVQKHYGGDFYAFVDDYYRLVGGLYEKTRCNIVGHLDLISKFNENNDLFDERSARYLGSAKEAIARLAVAPTVFEINTGAVSRGYRSEAYPLPSVREMIADTGKLFILNSDAHSKETLLFGIEKEREALSKNKVKYITSLYEII